MVTPQKSAAAGQRYKKRTKDWLEKMGYTVAFLERMQFIHVPSKIHPGEMDRMPIKKDQLGSDLLAISRDDVIFVQVKGGRFVTAGKLFPDACRKFQEFQFPSFVKLWVVAWPFGGRQPFVINAITMTHIAQVAGERTASAESLFVRETAWRKKHSL